MNAAYKLLAIVLIAVATFGAGYSKGGKAMDNAWKVKDAQRLQAAAHARQAEQLRGEKASGELQAQLLQRAIDNDQLQGAFNAYKRKHSILARGPLGRAAPASVDAAAAARGEPLPPGPDPALSYGAVWMWNSALLGRDAPAGSCGLADTATAACDADAGVGLQDAWDNQAINARICAEDRLRHQRLIDFLKGRK